MTYFSIIALLLLGIILVILEILVVPGMIVGIIGGGILILGNYLSYKYYGATVAVYTLLGTIVVTIVSLILSLKSKTWERMSLKSASDSKVNIIEENSIKEGDEGITISRLAPMGKVLINERYFEAESRNQIIDANMPVVVIKILDSKIIVKLKNN